MQILATNNSYINKLILHNNPVHMLFGKDMREFFCKNYLLYILS